MVPFNKIEAYCSILCEQIRWKNARGVVGEEIKTHLLDQRDAYMFDGDDEMVATDKAIVQMGDPIFIGEELDKTHKPKPQWGLLIFVSVFILFGYITNFYLSTNFESYFGFNSVIYVLTVGLLLVCYFLDFTILGKYAKEIYIVLLIVSLLSILLGDNVNGQSVWYQSGIAMTLSYLYLIYPLPFALMVYKYKNSGLLGVAICGLLYVPFAILLLLMNTMSGLIMYTICSLMVLTFAICRNWFKTSKTVGLLAVWVPTISFFIVYISHLLISRSYIRERLLSIFNPLYDEDGAGFLHNKVREVISNDSLFGKGQHIEMQFNAELLIGDGLTLTYLINEFGFIVLILTVILLLIFIFLSAKKALKEKSFLGQLVTITVVTIFTTQCIFSVLANLGYGFTYLASIPFMTNSGTSMCLNAMLIGFMLSVFRTGDVVRDYLILPQKPKGKSSDLFNYKIKLSIEKNK